MSFGGGSYIAVAASVGRAPDVSPLYWGVLSAPGAQGVAGPQGIMGLQGPTGLPGATGGVGSKGDAGPPGLQGVAGPAGGVGPAGPQGIAGPTGAQGLTFEGDYSPVANYEVGDAVSFGGSSYVSLAAGNRGQTPGVSPGSWALLAAAGAAGAKGADGAAGPAGVQGVAGPAGAQGAQGPQGLLGPQGPVGSAGPAGAQGPQGVQGAVGVTFRGAWTADANYAVRDVVTLGGSTYLAVSANLGQEPDVAPVVWAVLAQTGGAGPTGAQGAQGAAATVQVGSVTTLAAGAQATVTNSGTAGAAVLNFGIPQGTAGAAGSGGSSGGSGAGFAAMYHTVSFATSFYAVNAPTASATEGQTVLAWVPLGCSATRLDVFSQQSNAVTVTLRSGTPGSMTDTALKCQAASGGSCTSTGAVTIAVGGFIDLSIAGPSGTPAGVWTQVQCQ